jgi:hypothetical protein
MHFTTLTQTAFDAAAAQAIANQPLAKTIPFSSLTLIDDSTIAIGSTQIPMTESAFSDLAKLLGFPKAFDRSFTGAFGQEAKVKLLNALKDAIAAKGKSNGHTVTVLVSKSSRSCISIRPGGFSPISAETFLKTATETIDRHRLAVNSFSVSPTGELAISTTTPTQWALPGHKDESFHGGVTFLNDTRDGLTISPYLHRLVCANGMVGRSFSESMSFKSFGLSELQRLQTELQRSASRSFIPTEFDAKIRSAMTTHASILELESAHSALTASIQESERSIDFWAPLETTSEAYSRIGIDISELSKDQKKWAKSSCTVWELVNGITHFATHDNGFTIGNYQRSSLQVAAGGLLEKTHDISNCIASPF